MQVTTFELHEKKDGIYSVLPLSEDKQPVSHALATQTFDDLDKAFKAAKKVWPKAVWTNW